MAYPVGRASASAALYSRFSEEDLLDAIGKDPQRVKECLEAGVTPNAVDIYGTSALWCALASNQSPRQLRVPKGFIADVESAKFLIDKGADVSAQDYTTESSILHLAVQTEGGCEIVLHLLQKSADPNARTCMQETPLIMACQSWNKNTCQTIHLLHYHGADIQAKDQFGHTALHHALLGSAGGSLDRIQTLLILGADLNAQTDQGWTPLMCACDQGNVEVANLLLNSGANPDIATHNDPKRRGWKALDFAQAQSSPFYTCRRGEIVAILIANQQQDQGEGP